MGPEFLTDFIAQASLLVGETARLIDGLDARTAFFVGIMTWFLVEQGIRRLAGMLRVAILTTALAGTGLAVGIIALQTHQAPSLAVPAGVVAEVDR